MSKDYEAIPTFLGYSEEEVGVIAGGGIFGYGGVMLHEPTEHDFSLIVSDINDVSENPMGAGFGYSNVATITISGLLKWTNFNLARAPEGRQDVRETGLIRIEIFDEKEMREYVERESRLFEKLGIVFIG